MYLRVRLYEYLYRYIGPYIHTPSLGEFRNSTLAIKGESRSGVWLAHTRSPRAVDALFLSPFSPLFIKYTPCSTAAQRRLRYLIEGADSPDTGKTPVEICQKRLQTGNSFSLIRFSWCSVVGTHMGLRASRVNMEGRSTVS